MQLLLLLPHKTNCFEMEDPNSIALLAPARSKKEDRNGRSWEAIRINTQEHCPPQEKKISDLRSRESTAPLEDAKDNTQDSISYPTLELAFNSELKSGRGLMFGTNPNCDIVLPRLRNISQWHCYLTFDAKRRLILRDCSTNGTIVTYDGQGGELRRHFTWILGGHKVPQETERIVIEIQGVGFWIKVSRHDEHPDLYNASVDRFLKEADEPRLNGLGIYSPTALPSQSHTPNQGAIRLKQKTLGTGAFAVVRHYWDVSTGIDYAYKMPLDKRRFDRKAWEKEAEIMGQISHVSSMACSHSFLANIIQDHVVKLQESIFTPSPRLVLEYVPCGSLDGSELSLEETMTVLSQ